MTDRCRRGFRRPGRAGTRAFYDFGAIHAFLSGGSARETTREAGQAVADAAEPAARTH